MCQGKWVVIEGMESGGSKRIGAGKKDFERKLDFMPT